MTPEQDFVLVSDIPPERALAVEAEPGRVALFRLNGAVHAVDDACLHCGSSFAAGTLQGVEVACPACHWRYDVTTGCVRGVPALRLDTFHVTICGESVVVENCFVAHRCK